MKPSPPFPKLQHPVDLEIQQGYWNPRRADLAIQQGHWNQHPVDLAIQQTEETSSQLELFNGGAE